MSYETIAGTSGGGGIKSFAKFEDGESIEGHLVGLTPNQFNPERTDLNFQVSEGVITKVSRAGKLTYLEQDLEAAGKALVIGALTKLTRTGSYTAKGRDFSSPRYQLAQDVSNVLKELPVLSEGTGAATSEVIADRIAELKEEAKA